MLSCIEWIPRGVADPRPKRYELSKAESEMLRHQAQVEADDDDEDDDSVESMGEAAKQIAANPIVDPSSLPPDLRMDEYSDNEEDDDKAACKIGALLIGTDSGSGCDSNSDVRSNSDDDDDDLKDVADTREFMPVDVKGLEAMKFSGKDRAMGLLDDDASDDSDYEDTNLHPDDALIVVAKTDEDFATLEVLVYEEKSGNLFVHHDIPLPAFPLCIAHGDIDCDGNAGNFVAVGTFHSDIEIWNLDVLDALEPSCILGGEDTSAADDWMKLNTRRAANEQKMKKKKLGKRQSGSLKPGSHTDAVMALSWNKVHRHVLASGSADCTVKLWDITQGGTGGIAATYSHHDGKVQSLAWHPTEGTILATGSYDKKMCLVDARTNGGTDSCKSVQLPADCEAIAWDPHQSQFLIAASEDGTVSCWDVRKLDNVLWSFVAHESGCSDLSYNLHVPGMLATCSIDKTITLWDTQQSNNNNNKPISCGTKEMAVGKLYTVDFYPSSPWLLGCGGSGNELAIWDMSSDEKVLHTFQDRIKVPVEP